MRARKNNSKKLTVVLLSIILVLCCTIGGTLAWLQDSTDTVTNTFTVGKVDITLKETPYTADTNTYGSAQVEGQDNAYPAIPGATYKKDPTVAVVEGSEDCYLFVKFQYTADADTYLNYTSNLTTANGWTQISTTEANTQVWYRVVAKNAAANERTFALLADLNSQKPGFTLEIDSSAVTNDTIANAATQKLEWTAYAVQIDHLKTNDGTDISTNSENNAALAWSMVSSNS